MELTLPEKAKIEAFTTSAETTYDWITRRDFDVIKNHDGLFNMTLSKDVGADKTIMLQALFKQFFPK